MKDYRNAEAAYRAARQKELEEEAAALTNFYELRFEKVVGDRVRMCDPSHRQWDKVGTVIAIDDDRLAGLIRWPDGSEEWTDDLDLRTEKGGQS